MLLKNFRPKAKSTNAKTTLMAFSQPPDFGNLFNAEGKIAKRVKGVAKATP